MLSSIINVRLQSRSITQWHCPSVCVFILLLLLLLLLIINNECHSNIIVHRLQGCGHSKKLREDESESHSRKVV